MAERKYDNATLAGLSIFSRGTCYFPGCDTPIAIQRNGRPVIQCEIAHIAGLKPTAARYESSMTNAERNAWANLIYLCQADHTLVDRISPDDYPIETLKEWKADHERFGVEGLRGLTDLTRDELQSLLEETSREMESSVTSALADLRSINKDAADLLGRLLSDLTELGRRPIVDVDAALSLAGAADDLRHLPDTAPMLVRAADKLSRLDDTVDALLAAAEKIRRATPPY